MNHALPLPRRTALSPALMGMALWLFSEVMFFAALISAYFVARSSSISWPPLGQPRLPIFITGVNTAVLLASGWAMWTFAFAPTARQNVSRDRSHLLGALILGTAFVVVQGFEWIRLIGYGLRLTSGVYGSFFYLIIGAHALHALAGLAAMAFALSSPIHSRANGRQAVALYWLFVVALWPILYILVYLS